MMTLIKGAIVIKQFHPGKEQFVAENVRTACGTDLNTFPGSSHFLCHIGKVWAHFLIIERWKPSALQHIKGILFFLDIEGTMT